MEAVVHLVQAKERGSVHPVRGSQVHDGDARDLRTGAVVASSRVPCAHTRCANALGMAGTRQACQALTRSLGHTLSVSVGTALHEHDRRGRRRAGACLVSQLLPALAPRASYPLLRPVCAADTDGAWRRSRKRVGHGGHLAAWLEWHACKHGSNGMPPMPLQPSLLRCARSAQAPLSASSYSPPPSCPVP